MLSKFLPRDWSTALAFYVIHSLLVVYCVIQPLVNYFGLSTRSHIQFDLAKLADVNDTPVSKDTKDELSACDSVLSSPFTPLPALSPAFRGIIFLLMHGSKTFSSLGYREELPPFWVTLWSIISRLKSIVGDDNWIVLILDRDSYVYSTIKRCLPLTRPRN